MERMALWSILVGVTYFGAPALKFSTLLGVTEVFTIYSHESCTKPSRCITVAFGINGFLWGCKWGKSYVHIIIACV